MNQLHALPLLVKAAILGVVEGLTEFLPISSTGHLILTGSLLGWADEKAKVFELAIQTGAILAVVWLYREKILATITGLASSSTARRFALNVFIGFLPAAVLGVLFASAIKRVLFKPVPVAMAFILGAIVIIVVERGRKLGTRPPRVNHVDDLTALDAFKVGLCQALALLPGTSRSGATIIGGMVFGLARTTATEFSFFLAIPTLFGAAAYDVLKYRALLSAADVPLFAVGLVTAFVSAFACVRWLIRFVATHDFVPFAWYRIAFGVLVLVTAAFDLIQWVD
jgi:undecaprenyl-diphosphatase